MTVYFCCVTAERIGLKRCTTVETNMCIGNILFTICLFMRFSYEMAAPTSTQRR